jgi:protein SCO1/2
MRTISLCALFIAAVVTACRPAGPAVANTDPSLREHDGLVFFGNARFTGRILARNAAGRLISERSIRDGLLDGVSIKWYDNGHLAEQREYREGRKVGDHRGWWPNGTPQFACRFADGIPADSCTDWHDNGQVAMVHRYRHGEEDGLQQGWSRTGAEQFSYRMRDGRRYGLLGTVSCKSAALAEGTLPFYGDSTLTPEFTSDSAGLHQVGGFSLTDQRGQRISAADFDGRITVVTFFFASCRDLCPRLQSRLAAVRATYANDHSVRIVSITTSPEHDTAPVLAAYATANRIEAPDWLLLTGDRAEVERTARTAFFASTPMLRPAGGGIGAHGEVIWLVDSSRHIRGVYNGLMPLDTRRLIDDIALLRETPPPRGG